MPKKTKPNNFTWENEGDRWELFGSEGELVATVEPEPGKAPGWWQMTSHTGIGLTGMRFDAAKAAAERLL